MIKPPVHLRRMQVSSGSVVSFESSVVVSWVGYEPRTLRRSPHSMRRISTVSVVSGSHAALGKAPQSTASWSWYSSSHADFMLISRNRAKSFAVLDPQPSTILNAMDSAALTIWNLRDPRSLRGNFRMPLRTANTSSWALCHTSNRRKSCTTSNSLPTRPTRSRFPAYLIESMRLLTTTDNSRLIN